jgi:hypothetical protein
MQRCHGPFGGSIKPIFANYFKRQLGAGKDWQRKRRRGFGKNSLI